MTILKKEIKETAAQKIEREQREVMIRKIKNYTRRIMKGINTYDKAFDPIIDIYSNLMFQYDLVLDQFYKSGCVITEEYKNKNGAVNERKTAVYQSLETIRKDILVYSTQLGLNPKGLNLLKGKSSGPKESDFERALRGIGDGL